MKKLAIIVSITFGMLFGKAFAIPFSIKIVADNDFAVFTGTDLSINHLLYQNDQVWPDQISTLSTLQFNVAPGDNVFYILAMGGGGEENISGLINGVNMTDASVNVLMSSDISSFLTDYSSSSTIGTGGSVIYEDVESGVFSALLADIQAAFLDVSTTWSAPIINSTDGVIQSSGFNQGFAFNTLEARLFAFDIADVDVQVNAPSTTLLFLFSLLLMGLRLSFRIH